MPWTMVRSNVQDFDHWKKVFEGNIEFRRRYGSQQAMIFQDADDPNTLTVLVEFEDAGRMAEWAGSDELKQKMAEAGLTGPPMVAMVELADRTTG